MSPNMKGLHEISMEKFPFISIMFLSPQPIFSRSSDQLSLGLYDQISPGPREQVSPGPVTTCL